MARVSKGVRKTRNLSLQPDHELAVQFLRDDSGIEKVSPIVQEMIEGRMVLRLGENWREQVREWAANRALEAVA